MIAYFDTSALVKRYFSEEGSDRVGELIKEADQLETSALTELEMVAFLEQAKTRHKVDSPRYREVMANVERDIHDGTVSLVAIDPAMMKSAKRLIRLRRLRAPDSIQLATALSSRERLEGEFLFVCSDRPLLEAARLEGLKVLDPAS